MKTSGRNLNYRTTSEGANYNQVKKNLKKTITRITRRRLNRDVCGVQA